MKAFHQAKAAIRDQLESWGILLPRATSSPGPRVSVLAPFGRGMRLVGTLSQEGGEFVFKYDRQFVSAADAEPIPGFPQLESDYRSRELWPFFAVRIPPASRTDVRDALKHHGLRRDQTLEVLGTLARRSISNPYQLDLARAS